LRILEIFLLIIIAAIKNNYDSPTGSDCRGAGKARIG
jgi:hypothetical protein